jgi:hypothetical protein
MKNPIWKIEENGKEYLLMYCEKDIICRLCPGSYQKILDYEKFFLTNDKSCIKIDTSSREGFAPPTCQTRQGGQTMRPNGKERDIL